MFGQSDGATPIYFARRVGSWDDVQVDYVEAGVAGGRWLARVANAPFRKGVRFTDRGLRVGADFFLLIIGV